MKGIAEGTYNTKHAEAARLYYTTIYIHTHTPTELKLGHAHERRCDPNRLEQHVVARHESQQHDGVVGGTTDRNSLSARQANGAAMLVEVDTATVSVILLVRLIAEGREVVRRLVVRKEVEQPQKLAVNAPRGRHARRQEHQRPIARIWLPVAANLVSSGLVKELVGPIRVAQRAVA